MQQININEGSAPAIDLQNDNPRLRNGYISSEGYIELLPTIKEVLALDNIRAIHESTFRNRVIIATSGSLWYFEAGALFKVGDIVTSKLAFRMDENAQNQVILVNGTGAWVFDQNTALLTRLTSAVHGFDLVNPVDVTVLDTIAVIVGGTDKKWVPSQANNALLYNGNDAQLTDESMGFLRGCQHLDNNLFIFGEDGVQRWVPSIERTPTAFPFAQDPTYRNEFGCTSTASLLGRYNNIFYLTKNGEIRQMTSRGAVTVTNSGIERLIAGYSDIKDATAVYFYYSGNYFYVISFDSNTFVYSTLSKRFSEYDLDFVSGTDSTNLVATSTGIFSLSDDFTNDRVWLTLQTSTILAQVDEIYGRAVLSSTYLDIAQGKEAQNKQFCDFEVSKDNIDFGFRVRREFSPLAKRLRRLIWYSNVVTDRLTLRFSLSCRSDITIRRLLISFE